MSDADIGTISKKGKLPQGDKFNTELPKFACKCANEAINGGNAIFGIQSIGKCFNFKIRLVSNPWPYMEVLRRWTQLMF